MEELRAELALKDETVTSLQEELSGIEASLQQRNVASNSALKSAPVAAKASPAPSQLKPKPNVEVQCILLVILVYTGFPLILVFVTDFKYMHLLEEKLPACIDLSPVRKIQGVY